MALAVSACLVESTPKHLKPLSEDTKRLITQKGSKLGAPMFVRLFKEEAELEVWMAKGDGAYELIRSYEICNYSGVLGPKLKTGDKQAPEGFYVISPGQMNPKSKYHLAFNLGYPNAYDRSHNRTGAHLMVHGGCRSAGCYAVTDDQVQEIYALGRDAFLGGQRSFHVHALPFRLTEKNLKRHANSKWIGFWRNLKAGYDFFELHRKPPVVGVRGRKYVFFQSEEDMPMPKPRLRGLRRTADKTVLITGWATASFLQAHRQPAPPPRVRQSSRPVQRALVPQASQRPRPDDHWY